MSKVVLITGGSSGLGKAIGSYLAEKGYTVYGTSRDPTRFTDPFPFKLLKMDVTEPDSVSEAVSEVIEKEGGIDVLINNAGVGITGPIEEIPDREIKNTFETNLYGPIRVIKAVLPHMREKAAGHIINVTSIAGYMGLPYRGIYSASKASLEIVTEAFRMEIRQFGIRMSNIAPGDFATNIAAGRYHHPIHENSPYKTTYSLSVDIMNEHVDNGQDPVDMAKAVHKVINTSQPKVSYKVGTSLQKFSVVLKRILPSKVYENILLKHYKLK